MCQREVGNKVNGHPVQYLQIYLILGTYLRSQSYVKCSTKFLIIGNCRIRVSQRYNDAPERASRPFDKDRDGFVIGEGAGILILEELEHALNRGAPRIYGELIGFGASGDASHITAGRDDGGGAVMAMKDAVRDTGKSIGLLLHPYRLTMVV